MNRNLLCRTQFLSMQCTDSTTSFNNYDLNSIRALECGDDEVISVQLQSFSMNFDNYLINSTNNTFIINNSTYTIPPGSGPYDVQADQFNSMSCGITCTWDYWSNTFTWSNPNSLIIQFSGGYMWGLPDNYNTNAANFSSVRGLNLLSPNNIIIRENSLSKMGDNYELLNNEDGGISNIFHIISFDYNAHSSFTYNNNYDSYEHLISTKTIDQMNFDITDFSGNNIPWITNYFAVVRVRIYKKYNFFEDEALKMLKSNLIINKKNYQLAGHKYTEKKLSPIKHNNGFADETE